MDAGFTLADLLSAVGLRFVARVRSNQTARRGEPPADRDGDAPDTRPAGAPAFAGGQDNRGHTARRAFVSRQESRHRLPELVLLAGNLLSYVAATEPTASKGGLAPAYRVREQPALAQAGQLGRRD